MASKKKKGGAAYGAQMRAPKNGKGRAAKRKMAHEFARQMGQLAEAYGPKTSGGYRTKAKGKGTGK